MPMWPISVPFSTLAHDPLAWINLECVPLTDGLRRFLDHPDAFEVRTPAAGRFGRGAVPQGLVRGLQRSVLDAERRLLVDRIVDVLPDVAGFLFGEYPAVNAQVRVTHVAGALRRGDGGQHAE